MKICIVLFISVIVTMGRGQYYGILKDKKVNTKKYNEYPNTALTGINTIREIKTTDYRDCISICESEEATCKSMNVVTGTNNDITCLLYDIDYGTFETRSNTLFVSKEEPKCSGYCSALSYIDLCGRCKCKDKCNSLYSHYCDCTNALKEQKTCEAVKDAGFLIPALYNIKFDTAKGFKGFCETQSDGTVWLTMMRRQVINDKFKTSRTMDDYKNGFGNAHDEVYWLGLDRIKAFTQSNNTILRVAVTTYDGKQYFGEYENFKMDDQYNYVYTSYRTHCCLENGFAVASKPLSQCDNSDFWFDKCVGTEGYPTETSQIRWGRTVSKAFMRITLLLRHGSLPPVKDKTITRAGCSYHTGLPNGLPIKIGDNINENACIAACVERKLADDSINAVNYQFAVLPSSCYCVKGMSSRTRPDTNYVSCKLGWHGCTFFNNRQEYGGTRWSGQGTVTTHNECRSKCYYAPYYEQYSKTWNGIVTRTRPDKKIDCWCIPYQKNFNNISIEQYKSCMFGELGCNMNGEHHATGKGVGSKLEKIEPKYHKNCRKKCLNRKHNGEMEIDGVIFEKSTKYCWCAKGLDGSESYFKSCLLRNDLSGGKKRSGTNNLIQTIEKIDLIQPSQSSNFSDFTLASKALDGGHVINFKEGKGCSLTKGDHNPWWKAGIGEPHIITKVRIYPRRDCCQDRYSKVIVLTSMDGKTWDLCSDLGDTLKRAKGWVGAVCPANTMGLYVKVILQHHNVDLALCELQVMGYPATDLALNKPSEQSSTYGGNNEGNKAFNANDGKASTRSVTSYGSTQWWSVDLQNATVITGIVIHYTKYAITQKFYSSLSIRTRVDQTDQWTLCTDISSPPDKKMSYICDKPTNARYVRILSADTGNSLYLEDVEVFGKQVKATTIDNSNDPCESVFTCEINKEWEGGAFKTSTELSIHACLKKCCDDKDCWAVSWDEIKKKCHLLKKINWGTLPTDRQGSTLCKIGCAKTNIKYKGTELTTKSFTSWERCVLECRLKYAECLYWTYSQGICTLYSQVDKEEVVPNAISGERNCGLLNATGVVHMKPKLELGMVQDLGEFCISFDLYIFSYGISMSGNNILRINDASTGERIIYITINAQAKKIVFGMKGMARTYEQSIWIKRWYNIKINRYRGQGSNSLLPLEIRINGARVYHTSHNSHATTGTFKVFLAWGDLPDAVLYNFFINGQHFFDPYNPP